MGILSKSLISKRLSLPVDHPDSIVITPFLAAGMDSDTVDLRLGSHFLFPPLPYQVAIDISAKTGTAKSISVHIPKGGELVLPAHQTVLGSTLEFIKLAQDVSGQILTKSSVARNFMVIETAPWIHPGYRGCLTLEIANVSNAALILKPEMAIGQLIFMTIDEPERSTMLSGSYIGPVRPESPLHGKRHSHS
jgi:dCTP deaminase